MKIVLIANNENLFKTISSLAEQMIIKMFPPDKETFTVLRGCIHGVQAAGNTMEVVEKRTATIENLLAPYVGEDILFIIDYNLDLPANSRKSFINGIRFYEQFAQYRPAIFMYEEYYKNEKSIIRDFCNVHNECICIPNDTDNFKELLKEKIKQYEQKETFIQ
jgi:hypothetical protein